MVAALVLSVLVALMTAAAIEGLEATTLDFLAEGRDKHEHGILEHVNSEIDSLGKLPNNLLRQPSNGKGKVIDIHLGDDNVGPSRLQSVDEVKHEHPKLGRGEARASGDASGRNNESGVHAVDSDGSGESVRRKAEPEDGNGVAFDLRSLGKHPMWHSFEGFD